MIQYASLLELVFGVVFVAVLGVGAFWLVLKLLQGLQWVGSTVVGGVAHGLDLGGRGVGAICSHTGRFVGSTCQDGLRLVGGVLTAVLILPLIALNFLIGRWSASRRLTGAFGGELRGSALSIYRLAIGNPVRFLGLGVLTDGIERRLPAALDQQPMAMPATPASDPLDFEGYEVLGELPRGGSGAHLYIAEPDEERRAFFAAAGRPWDSRVVLKAFSFEAGSTLPQIVRESRALEAARELGLVLDHELTPDRFYYAMPYVPGEDLGVLTARLHEESEEEGLDDASLREALLYVCHLLETLDRFHAIGLWHKDIKPSNVIVSDHRAHLVDLGLVTPLRSAMTLTTHGTEYYRDPEMVRQAMKGAKVHEIDGVKFDLYSLGALLYTLVENTIPAHGSLSQISKRCPESVRWIVRRAMADVGKRYGSSREMLADVRVVLAARDPHSVLPAALPSISGRAVPMPPPLPAERGHELLRKACARPIEPAPLPPPLAAEEPELEGAPAPRRSRSRLRLAGGILAAIFVGGTLLVFLGVPSRQDYSSFPAPQFASASQRPVGVTGLHTIPSASSTQEAGQAQLSQQGNDARQASAGAHWTDEDLRNGLPDQFQRVLGNSGEYWFDKLQGLEAVLDARAPRDGRVELLILPAVGAGIEDEYLGELERTLSDARFRILDTEGDAGLELEAEVRQLVGLRGVGDNYAAEELVALVQRKSPRLDAILWLGRHADDPEKLVYRMLTASGETLGLNNVALPGVTRH